MVFKSPVNDEVEYKLDCEAAARLAAALLMTAKKADDEKADDVLGDLKSDDGTITADIVTVDNSLVQQLKVDRHTGAIEYQD